STATPPHHSATTGHPPSIFSSKAICSLSSFRQRPCGRCFSWLLWETSRNHLTPLCYTADMLRLLNEISTQLSSLGLKFSDFSNAALARLLTISASSVEATKVATALLTSPQLKQQQLNWRRCNHCVNYLTFFGETIYQALGSGGSYSGGGSWTLALSGAALLIDYGICVDGYPSEVYIFTQATWTSSASLLSDSLTTSSQTGARLHQRRRRTCRLLACVTGNALAEISILPVDFFYNAKLSRTDGIVINATSSGAAAATFLADLTADGCRTAPTVTQVCTAGNFKRMKIGELIEYRGTIEEFPGSENVSASNIYDVFCYTVKKNWRSWPSSPRSCSTPQLRCSASLRWTAGGRLALRPAAAAVAAFTNMTYSGGQWITTGSDGALTVDLTAGGCRRSAGGDSAEFFSTNTLTRSSAPTAATPWCQSYSVAPSMKTLFISFQPSSAIVYLKWTISGCFSTLPAYCLTTTAAPVTATTVIFRPSGKVHELDDADQLDPNVLASAISGGSFVSSNSTWTICILGNAATVRVDFVGEDNSVRPCRGSSLCFTFPSGVYAKSLVLLPTALKTASASDAAYSLMVNLSACYSSISASCYSPICGCSANYRPVFYSKRYYRISFAIVSGFYGTYKSTYASPVTSDYMDLLNMTDTMTNMRASTRRLFTSGSVAFQARLIMYDGGYSASALDAALTAGMASYTAGATYVVDASSVVIT
uniref:CUB domain-containing protein n=1 Tax=Macrostomum lignano TaxID=282301 RepID=A0A1I8FEV3_9PLAT